MKKQKCHLSQITIREVKSNESPAEYSIRKASWDKFWDEIIGNVLRKIAEDKKQGIKTKPVTKGELVKSCFDIAEQLNVRLPKSISKYYNDDIYFIKWQLEYELRLRKMEEDGCKVVYEPPRLPISEIIAGLIEKAKIHKARGLDSFLKW